MKKWEVRGPNNDGVTAVLAWGESEATFPSAGERKSLRACGNKIFVDGKLYTR